jgi:hypothetical protein
MLLPPRPLKLRASFVLWNGAGGGLLVLVGVALVAAGPWIALSVDALDARWLAGVAQFVFLGGLLLWLSRFPLREVALARRCARDSHEIELEVAEEERHGHKYAAHNRSLQTRIYFFRVGTGRLRYAAGKASNRPLFLDEAHTRALALRATDGGLLIVRTDLGPFAFAPSEERAIRERLEKVRDGAQP